MLDDGSSNFGADGQRTDDEDLTNGQQTDDEDSTDGQRTDGGNSNNKNNNKNNNSKNNSKVTWADVVRGRLESSHTQ